MDFSIDQSLTEILHKGFENGCRFVTVFSTVFAVESDKKVVIKTFFVTIFAPCNFNFLMSQTAKFLLNSHIDSSRFQSHISSALMTIIANSVSEK